jgi:hypothetical protein
MPFEPNKKIPRLHEYYNIISDLQQLSYNSFFHIANRYSDCIKNKIVEIMNAYLVTNLTGTVPTNVPSTSTVLGEGNAVLGANHRVIGNDNSIAGFNNDVFGTVAQTYENTSSSILIGSNPVIGSIGLFISDSIAIGSNSYSTSSDSISIGKGASIGGNSVSSVALGTYAGSNSLRGLAIGNNSYIDVNSDDSLAIGVFSYCNGFRTIAIGRSSTAGASDAAQIGDGTNNTANTLQFGNAQIAHKTHGIKLKTNTTAPIVTSADIGTLGLNANTPQYVDSSGSWQNLGGTNTNTKYVPFYGNQLIDFTVSPNSYEAISYATIALASPPGFSPASDFVTYNLTNKLFTFLLPGLYSFEINTTVVSSLANHLYGVNFGTATGGATFLESKNYITEASSSWHSRFSNIMVSVPTAGASISVVIDNTYASGASNALTGLGRTTGRTASVMIKKL